MLIGIIALILKFSVLRTGKNEPESLEKIKYLPDVDYCMSISRVTAYPRSFPPFATLEPPFTTRLLEIYQCKSAADRLCYLECRQIVIGCKFR